jgi:hypothetical protein|tara:strand:- start:1143 stop:1472 length:330 start_codon:yes stop_codon:yes gene_type:complete
MKYLDLLDEATTEQSDIVNDLEELITRAKARDFTKLSTPAVLAKMQAMGYSVDMSSLKSLLNNIQSVGSANDTETTLDTALPDSIDSQKQASADVVSKLANKQVMKGVK